MTIIFMCWNPTLYTKLLRQCFGPNNIRSTRNTFQRKAFPVLRINGVGFPTMNRSRTATTNCCWNQLAKTIWSENGSWSFIVLPNERLVVCVAVQFVCKYRKHVFSLKNSDHKSVRYHHVLNKVCWQGVNHQFLFTEWSQPDPRMLTPPLPNERLVELSY